MEERVLGPIGMTESTYEQPLPDARVASAAAGYDAHGGPVAGKRHVYPEMAPAGLWTTPTDLARFAIELALESRGKSARVLSQAMAVRMLTKVAPTASEDSDVALGIFLGRHGGVTYFGHDGADDGFQAVLLANAETGCGAALMANSDEGVELINEVLPAIAAEYDWPGFPAEVTLAKVDPAALAAVAGTYQVSSDRMARFAVEGDHLVLRTPFLADAELLPISPTTFVRRDDPRRYTFTATGGAWTLAVSPALAGARPILLRVADDATVPLDDVAAGRVEEAVARYRAARAASPRDHAFSEERLNDLGVDRLESGEPDKAVLLLRVANLLFPGSMNTYDSLGEAYLAAGDRANAIAAFRGGLAAEARDAAIDASTKRVLHDNALKQLAKLGAAASAP